MRNRMWAKAKQSSLSAKRYASKRYFDYREKRYDFHKLNVCYTFPMFQPYSSGTYEQRAELTINCINQTIPSLGSLATSIECRPPIVVKMEDFPKTEDQLRSANELKRYFDRYGSDKATLLVSAPGDLIGYQRRAEEIADRLRFKFDLAD
jgi:hypothetical protein